MGDLSEFYKEEKQAFKERCTKRNAKYEPQLKEIGAIYKADGIYELDGYFLYPTKGFAMSKSNSKKRMKLDKFINKKRNQAQMINGHRIVIKSFDTVIVR